MPRTLISSQTQLKSILDDVSLGDVVIYFSSPQIEQCSQMSEILEELESDPVAYNLTIVEVDSEKNPELFHEYDVKVVPTLISCTCGFTFDRIEGFDTFEVINKFFNEKFFSIDTVWSKVVNKEEIVVLVDSSAQKDSICRALHELELSHVVSFVEVSLLQTSYLRKNSKLCGDLPQIYKNGVSIGILDVDGDFSGLLEQIRNLLVMGIDDRLKNIIGQKKVMLFMKGSPDMPRCGFSRRIVELLRSKNVEFGYFDILTDEEVRQELKRYSNWPTYPQLYVNSSLVGGLDVVKELIDNDELEVD